ncbi:hypothetical protein K469DRAFT_709212 [Zopfia rhizophila CBS 207.26]|uniref:Uncharacterized protein n=1 Tax=Zopfia rhizophila CBS 207.26 TaxID=1314779 RepID=A0A6A6E2U2_9PEZI|nr:hypothetical protein K469DRAFT_709212 [Zopfia rhizophila CBS 207.26]
MPLVYGKKKDAAFLSCRANAVRGSFRLGAGTNLTPVMCNFKTYLSGECSGSRSCINSLQSMANTGQHQDVKTRAVNMPSVKIPQKLQVIEDRYIDAEKLADLLENKFGVHQFTIRYKFNKWYIEAPEILDEASLEQCEIQY